MRKISLKIKVIHWLTQFLYLLTSLFCLGVIILAFFFFTGIVVDELKLNLKLPITSSSEEVGVTSFYGQKMNVTFSNAIGLVKLTEVPQTVSKIFSILMVTVALVIYYIVYLFQRFIKNVNRGIVFTYDNSNILRKLGITFIGLYLYMFVTEKIWKHGFPVGQVDSDIGLQVGGGSLMIFLLGLFVLMLSQIFIHGIELQKENELTI